MDAYDKATSAGWLSGVTQYQGPSPGQPGYGVMANTFSSGAKGLGMEPISAGLQIGGALISGLFGSRAQKKQDKNARRMARYDFDQKKYFTDVARQDELKKQRYKEDAIAGYRQYSPIKGTTAPIMTDPGSINPALPVLQWK